MSEKEQQRLERNLDKIEDKLPDFASNWLAWVRKPSHRLFRIPLGIMLIFGGIFSILPLLGAWMLPLGLMLLAIDVPFLQRPVNALIRWAERLWMRWKNRKRAAS
jgi:membrane-bound ClpP family serine protease